MDEKADHCRCPERRRRCRRRCASGRRVQGDAPRQYRRISAPGKHHLDDRRRSGTGRSRARSHPPACPLRAAHRRRVAEEPRPPPQRSLSSTSKSISASNWRMCRRCCPSTPSSTRGFWARASQPTSAPWSSFAWCPAGSIAGLGSGTAKITEWSIGTLIVLASLFAAIALHTGARLVAYRSMGVSNPARPSPLVRVHLPKSQPGAARRGREALLAWLAWATLVAFPGAAALCDRDSRARKWRSGDPDRDRVDARGDRHDPASAGLGLSGGDLFRSLVWYLTDNIIAGARLAAAYAFLIGIALMATGLGVIGLGGVRPYLGIWAIVAGWQLSAAARLDVLPHAVVLTRPDQNARRDPRSRRPDSGIARPSMRRLISLSPPAPMRRFSS